MDIAAWLRELGLERYEQAFRDNDIDGKVLPHLTAEDLKDIGITSVGHRRSLLAAIKALRWETAPPQLEEPSETALPAAEPSRQAERRQLTVMFIDLVGSTALSARLDPEDMGQVIRAYQRRCTEIVRRWDGNVAKYMGDGVLVYFGWPRAHEDDAERAVCAGLELVSAVGRLVTPVGETLAARVGIATGLVMVGDLIGEGAAREETVVGETPNLAARLQGLAGSGAVVIAQSTRQLLGDLFDLEDVGAHDLKGIGARVQAWRVVAEGQAESRFEALRGGHLAALIGREHELGLLVDRWERAKKGDGQVVLLGGEPGIGKSRIASALRERLGDEYLIPLSHYCSPYHTNTALHPVIGLLERAAGFARDDRAEAKLDKLEALLARDTEALGEAVPLVAALLGIETGERYPPLVLSPQRQKQRTLEVLVDQVRGLAARRPVLAVYEDVHWADPTTRELLGLLIDRVRRLFALVLITFRPQFDPPWTGEGHVTQLQLNRLGRREGAALVERITGGKALPNNVLEQILSKTDGVPLFIEELTKAVLESGLLSEASDHYELAGALPPLAIPTTLHDSLMARLDRFAPVKEVAQTAAVIGREFDHQLVAAVFPSPERLNDALDQLVTSELVFRHGTPPEATYTFKHALVQEAAYNSLLKSRRQQLHGRIARALEQQFPEVAAQRPEVLARHLTDAELTEQAVDYWHKAGQQAAERCAHKEAIAHLTRGLELLQSLPGAPEHARKEIRLQNALGVSLMATKGPAPEVAEAYLRARELAERIGDTRQAYAASWGLWYFNHLQIRFKTARDIAYELLELARRERDEELLLQAHHAAWPSLLYGGEILLCRDHAEQGLALYDPHEHRLHAVRYGGHDPGVCSRYHQALALWLLGFPDQAVAAAQDAVRLATEIEQPISLAIALCHVSFLHQFRGEARLAQEWGEATMARSAEQAIFQFQATGTIIRGWAVAAQGDLEAGTAAIKEGLAALRAAEADVRRSYYLALLADICGRAGRSEAAQRAIAEALMFAEESGEHWWVADLHRLKGELLLTRSAENRAEAEACFRRALNVAHQQSGRAFELRAATSLARLWRDHSERQRGYDLLASVYGWFTEGFDTADLKDAKALLDELA
jgi:predicted ATPase/class 3 adenylate cyclase